MTSSDSESPIENNLMKWEDLRLPTVNIDAYDFAPFLDAPAVKVESGSDSQVNLLNIPRSKLPSPLADNLSPRTVKDIKEYLVGIDGHSGYGGNGKEIWLSWKRAWDIWNNYYMEGRVNPIWIREEWERREKRNKAWDAGRNQRRRDRERNTTEAAGRTSLVSEDQQPKSKTLHENISKDLFSESFVSGWNLGDPSYAVAPWDPKNPETPPSGPINIRHKWITVKTVIESEISKQWVLIDRVAADDRPKSPKVPKKTATNSDDKEDRPPKRQTFKPRKDLPPKLPATTTHTPVESDEDEDIEIVDIKNDGDLATFINDVESETDSEPPPEAPNRDGSGGGYTPLKIIKEYQKPDEEQNDGTLWIDAVANTVWAPRRVGEKKLNIELDDDIESSYKKADFQTDGGVDCSRSPFPVLRPLTEYVRTPNGAYRKKRAWDGVTGTIFNMATLPLEPYPETTDERTQRIKNIYTDRFRENLWGRDSEVFPLDIRRVLKVVSGQGQPRDICDPGEERVRDPALYPDANYRKMNLDDPWYVTDAQKQARDAPPRHHPPKQEEFSGSYLPLDNQLWREEQLRDLNGNAGYFVTNLHVGTLIVNGMEIKKGDVAGPLPEFAIIECPGGQIVFWWGVNGRDYGHGRLDVDHSSKWEILRRVPGWEHVAKSAGEVWNAIIRDRKKREKTGENEDDDEQWDRWKRAKEADPRPDDITNVPRKPGYYRPVPFFTPDNGKEELKWLNVQAEEKKAMLERSYLANAFNIPDECSYWPGITPPIKLSHEFTEAEKEARWRAKEVEQLKLQRDLNEAVMAAKAKARERMFESEKRRAEEKLESVTKRRKLLYKHIQEVEKRIKKDLKEREEAKITETMNDKIKEKQLLEAAMVAIVRKNNPNSSAEDILCSIENHHKEEEARLEKRRVDINKVRKAKGLPKFSPAPALGADFIKAATRTQSEEGRKRRSDEERRAQNEQVQQAKRARRTTNEIEQQAQDVRAPVLSQSYKQKGSHAPLEATEKLVPFYRATQLTDTDVAAHNTWQKGQTQKKQDNQGNSERGAYPVLEDTTSTTTTAAAVHGVQTRRESLLKQSISQKRGITGHLLAGQNVVALHENSMTVADHSAYLASKNPTVRQSKDQQDASEAATHFAQLEKQAQQMAVQTIPIRSPPTIVPTPPKLPPGPVTIPKPTTRAFIPKVTSPTLPNIEPPATFDKNLLRALQKYGDGDPELLVALARSMETFDADAAKALQTRAASENMTREQYAFSQGYATVESYLNNQKMRLARETKALPDPRKTRTEHGKNDAHLESYKDEMQKAIKAGIRVRARQELFPSADAYAFENGHQNLSYWAEELLQQMNLTLDVVPSRKPLSEMTPEEDSVDATKWKAWCTSLIAAAEWEARIASLPAAPDWSPVTKMDGWDLRDGETRKAIKRTCVI